MLDCGALFNTHKMKLYIMNIVLIKKLEISHKQLKLDQQNMYDN